MLAPEWRGGARPPQAPQRGFLGPPLGALTAGRDNNLNLIRMIAAAAVLVSHAFPIARGFGVAEPLQATLGMTLGTAAVCLFFAASGFLIAQSWDRSPGVGAFLAARALRIFPALAVVAVLTALVLGPLVTVLPVSAYFADPATGFYVMRNVTLVSLQYGLPGVFADHPYPAVINGSLWTLFHELTCYGLVFAAGIGGLLTGGWRGGALIGAGLAACALWLWTPGLHDEVPGWVSARLGQLVPLAVPFMTGMALYLWRDRIPLGWPAGTALAALAWALRDTGLWLFAFNLALAYWTFLLACRVGGAVRWYNRLGDYSYGVYIWAFPMQQLAVYLWGPMDPWTNIALASAPTLVLAVLSWHLVEKPALALRRRGAGAAIPCRS